MGVLRRALMSLATYPEDRDDARLIEVGPAVVVAEKKERRAGNARKG